MTTPQKYQSETKTAALGGSFIQIENRTPVLSTKDKEKRRREIESRLFDVFSKYDGGKSADAK